MIVLQRSLIGFNKSSECDRKLNLKQMLNEEWTGCEKLSENERKGTDDNGH